MIGKRKQYVRRWLGSIVVRCRGMGGVDHEFAVMFIGSGRAGSISGLIKEA